MFCLKCKRLSPVGSAYCAYCPGKYSFNGIICSGGHRCHVGSQCCPTCGSSEFSEHTWGIRTGWIAKLGTVALLVYLWKVGLAHGGDILPILESGAAYTFGFMTNSDSNASGNALRTIFAYGFVFWMIGLWMHILPGQGGVLGKFFRSLPVRVYQLTLRWIPRVGLLLWRGVMRVSGLAASKPAALPGKSKDKTGKGEL